MSLAAPRLLVRGFVSLTDAGVWLLGPRRGRPSPRLIMIHTIHQAETQRENQLKSRTHHEFQLTVIMTMFLGNSIALIINDAIQIILLNIKPTLVLAQLLLLGQSGELQILMT